MQQQPEARPYRSHKLPACGACRHRKGRCEVDDPSEPCRYCRKRKVDCDHGMTRPSAAQLATGGDQTQPSKRASTANSVSVADAAPTPADLQPLGSIQEAEESSPVMVNPSMAEDVDILERHLASQVGPNVPERRPYVRLCSANGESIVYRTVARRRKGLQQTSTPGLMQLEIIENVLGALKTDVIRLYFDKVHPCFPLLDESSFWSLWRKDSSRISPTLLCDIYAVALAYWNNSELLRGHARPDVQFVWNQAVLALRDDFMAPSMATVHAALLDMLGRPIYHITGNIMNAGRTVNLAHSQGLHRDPSKWRISDAEKNLRMRVWWALVIHDHWSSLSHGTPPNISSQNYDVALPAAAPDSKNGASSSSSQVVTSFPHLCSLTKLLGALLPMIYSLRANNAEHWKQIRRIECSLDDWVDALPDCLNQGEKATTEVSAVPGTSGLWFYYLSLKLVLNRLAFRVTDETQKELHHYRLALLRTSAISVVDYVTSLQEEQFKEFWLPYTAYSLVSATTTLLRLLVESGDAIERREICSKLLSFLGVLILAREHYGWDLAQLCIDTCGEPIEKLVALSTGQVLAARGNTMHTVGEVGSARSDNVAFGPNHVHLQDTSLEHAAIDEIPFPLDLDIPWDYLWDDLVEPWPLDMQPSTG